MNALPFARQMRVRESLSVCAQLLAQPGNVLIIFPGGHALAKRRDRRLSSRASARFSPDAGRRCCRVTWRGRSAPGRKGGGCRGRAKVRLIIGAPRRYDGEEAGAIAAELREAVEALREKHGSG